MMENYLLLPSVPTPNGRLHLGHIGGPYLATDICARHLRMQGHHTVIMSGVDSYDSFVIEAAFREGMSPTEVNAYYYDLIVNDLLDMNIALDAFINPLLPQWHELFKSFHYKLLKELEFQNAVSEISEYLPWDLANQSFLTGYALSGFCPYCHKGVAGYFCETCGAHFKPEEVQHKQSVHEKQVNNLFLKVPKEINLSSKGVSEAIHLLYKKVFAAQNYYLRLTTHANWGLATEKEKQVLFNYSFIYAYFLTLGEIARRFFKKEQNAFAQHANVKIICAFGIDNAMPFIGGISGVTGTLSEYKSVDHYLINHFYHLNGKKFSSSKQHAIWVNDVIKQKLDVDVVRLYLASIDVRNQIGNVTQQKLLQFHECVTDWFMEYVEKAFVDLPAVVEQPDAELLHHLQYFMSMQLNVLQLDNFLPHIAVKLIKQCMSVAENKGNFWWLKALSIMLFPFMPVIGKKLWNALGYLDEPQYEHFLQLPLKPLAANFSLNLPLHFHEKIETCA